MAVLVDLTKCIGCESCVVACKMWNALPYKKNTSLQTEEKELNDQYWTVIQKKTVRSDDGKENIRFVKKQCMHCLEPACASACFSKALRMDENHAVVYYPELCVGCRYCMIACPYDVPKYQWEETFPLVEKCQFCSDRLASGDLPACVSVCPTGALQGGEREELLKKAHDMIKGNSRYIDHVYGEKEVGGSSWLYISDKPFEELGFKMNLEEVSPVSYTKSYLSKVPFLAAAWGLFLTGLAIYHHRVEKNKPGKGKEHDEDE